MFTLHILRMWLMFTVVFKLSLWIVTFLCLFSWHVLITHSHGFAEGMWLCGITACLLPIDGVKQRTTSLLPHDHNPLDLHHHQCYHHLLPSPRPDPPTGSQQTATSEEVVLVPCRRATKQAAQGANTPPLTSVSPSSLLFHPLKSLPRLFFNEKKAETCQVCFSPSFGQVPAFKAQVLASTESSFRKTWGGSLGHGGGVEGSGGGGWTGGGGGGGGWHGWILMSTSGLDVSSSKPVGRSVSRQSNCHKHIPPRWLALNIGVMASCCFSDSSQWRADIFFCLFVLLSHLK